MAGSIPLTRLPVGSRRELAATWRAADPERIATMLAAATARESGWYVVGSSTDVPAARSITRVVDGREVALWRSEAGQLAARSGQCPHLGALLEGCEVFGDRVVCRWHGLPLRGALPAFDDGHLVWVRLGGDTPEPALPTRPASELSVAAVISLAARCEPRDIIANRLDPWHGAWFHPYAFSHLRVDEAASTTDRLVLEVAYRVAGSWAVPVTVDFACPDARTIVMTILDGEGVGSVVETHATPIGLDAQGHPTTVMTELTVAASDRPGFRLARAAQALLKPGMRHAARRLWADDLVYAERLYQVRVSRRA